MVSQNSRELLGKAEGERRGRGGSFKKKKKGFREGGDGGEKKRRAGTSRERTIRGVVGGEKGISFSRESDLVGLGEGKMGGVG